VWDWASPLDAAPTLGPRQCDELLGLWPYV